MSNIKRSDVQDLRIAEGAANLEKDKAIWKAYSKRGGFYDSLRDFCQAVKKPSANALDYDEQEGTYMLCITLYNTIWRRMKADMVKLQESLAQAERKKKDYVPATYERTCTKAGKTSVKNTLYASLRHMIADLFLHKKKETAAEEQYECRETVYDRSALELAEYQMKHARLFGVLSSLIKEMGECLMPVRGENRQALEVYKAQSKGICQKIESDIFSQEKWFL